MSLNTLFKETKNLPGIKSKPLYQAAHCLIRRILLIIQTIVLAYNFNFNLRTLAGRT